MCHIKVAQDKATLIIARSLHKSVQLLLPHFLFGAVLFPTIPIYLYDS